MATKYLIGLDIGSRFVKMVELALVKKDQLSITNVKLEEVASPGALRDVLKGMLLTTKFKTKRVCTAVSGRSVIVRYITMPLMGPEEMLNAIKFEATKYIPFEIQDVQLDAQKLQQGGTPGVVGLNDKEMRVLLVAVKKNVIDEHAALLEECGFIPDMIDFDAFALGNAFEVVSKLRADAAESKKIIALVDIGASKASINILDDNTSQFTREIYIAGNDFTAAIAKKLSIDPAQAELIKKDPGDKAEEIKDAVSTTIDDLCHEIRLSFDYFENQFDKQIETIFLTGGSSKMVGIEELIERALEKKPVKWDPTDVLPITSADVDQMELKHNAVQMAISIGLAARIMRS